MLPAVARENRLELFGQKRGWTVRAIESKAAENVERMG